MKNGYFKENIITNEGVVAGGICCGRGFTISWQNGPLGRDNEKKEPNGAFVEDIIDAMISRLECYQNSTFKCQENEDAIEALKIAAKRLDNRTKERESRKVEGTYNK